MNNDTKVQQFAYHLPSICILKARQGGSRGRRGEKDLKRDGGLLRHSRETTKTVLWNFSVFIFFRGQQGEFFSHSPKTLGGTDIVTILPVEQKL